MNLDAAVSVIEAEILAAFRDAAPPLIEWSTNPGDPESSALQRAFQGRNWESVQSVPFDLLRYHVTVMPLFQPKAFRYFLPAFMLGALSPADTAGTVTQFVVYALTPSDDPSQRDWWQHRMIGFSDQQIAAIRNFLCLAAGWLCDLPDEFDCAETALQEYWLNA